MSQRPRSAIIAVYLLLCILLGGSSQGVWMNLALQLLGIAVIAWAAIAGAPAEEEGDRATAPYLLLGLGLVVVLLQLIPMPASLWSDFPGRQDLARGYSLLGLPLPPLPVSEAPYLSVTTVFALIPAVAIFAAATLLRASPRWLAMAVVAGMACSILLGALQVANGPRSWPYLYDITNAGAVGVFANRNHMGTLLLVSIPFGTALMVSTRAQGSGSRQGRLALGIAGLVLVVVGIALNGSVAALALALPVLLASAALVPAAVRWRRVALPIAAVALIGGVVIVGTNPIPSVATDLGAAESVQSRGQMWSTTETAIRDTFPLGTGLGTFEQVYRQYEQPGQITRSYVNHAHNDYLELALELGAAGIVLMVLFLAWWAIAAVRVWTTPLSSAFGRAATIASAVILAHSIVDYPLRTAAISAVFAACIGLMAQTRPRGDDEPRHIRIA